MKWNHYIGLFFMLLMLGAALQPLNRFVVDFDIEISDSMDTESKDNVEKILKSDLFLVVLIHKSYFYNLNFNSLNFSDDLRVNQQFDDIILPPPEC